MQLKLEKKFGQSPVFVASARMQNGGMARNASPACLLKEAIQVISCGYEDKTEWGKEVRNSSFFYTFSCRCSIRKIRYHIKTISTLVWFGLYTKTISTRLLENNIHSFFSVLPNLNHLLYFSSVLIGLDYRIEHS